jgi:hypothetical protein
MKIVMTLLVRNEDDIIRENLEYHLKNGVDYFLITDHHSRDNTLEIINEYVEKGVAEVRVEQSEEHHQAAWVTDMARRACVEHEADWVINNDADEFWVPPKGNLKDFFEAVDPNVYKLHVSRFDFFYLPYDLAKFYEAMLFRETSRRWTKCCHRAVSDITVEVGNHDANSEILKDNLGLSVGAGNISIFHYPVRTVERYKAKMVEGTASVLGTPGIPAEMFFHWKRALQYIQDNNFEEYLREFSRDRHQINEGIQNGSILFDDTLQKFFYNLYNI